MNINTQSIDAIIQDANSEIFKNILDIANVNYCIVAPDGTILVKNKTLQAIIPEGLTSPEVDAVSWAHSKKVMEGNETVTLNESFEDKHFLSVKKPLIQNGECKGILIFSFDITKEKKAEIAKQLFVESMGHDLRTPFSGCLGAAQVLIRSPKMPIKERQEFLEDILKSGRRVVDMFNQVLDMIAVDKPQAIKTFSTTVLIDQVNDLYAAIMRQKQLTFINTSKASYEVTANKFALETILINLVGNAVKFTKVGSITLACDVIDNQLMVMVQDTGIGIDKHHHAMIFDKFTKVIPTYKLDEHQGTGRGLYLVKHYTETLHGKVKLASELGVGSKFTVTIPLK